jgi:hypothetical protein
MVLIVMQYNKFWMDPGASPLPWLALLYMILCISCFYYFRSEEELPGNLGHPMECMTAFQLRAIQALVTSDYTKPGRYKIETLMLYFGTEYVRATDAQVSLSVLLAIIIRTAIHAGYHRDAKHYPELSFFEGEMRRRAWTFLVHIDHLISFQTGVPLSSSSANADTALPSNLLDDDFSELTTAPPPSRPETERTPVLYTIAKQSLVSVFGAIAFRSHASQMNELPYSEIMSLDRQLQNARSALPPSLRIKPVPQSITDPPDLIMSRYNLELLYQKSRCILHRKYLTTSRSNLRFTYSRYTCVEAATILLRHQIDLSNEVQPGGLLFRDRWFLTSLTTHDFLLAAMILCLELAQNGRCEVEAPECPVGGKQPLQELLMHARAVWKQSSETTGSKEAKRAYLIISIMLDKMGTSAGIAQGGRSSTTDEMDTSNVNTIEPATVLGTPDRSQGTVKWASDRYKLRTRLNPNFRFSVNTSGEGTPLPGFWSLDLIKDNTSTDRPSEAESTSSSSTITPMLSGPGANIGNANITVASSSPSASAAPIAPSVAESMSATAATTSSADTLPPQFNQYNPLLGNPYVPGHYSWGVPIMSGIAAPLFRDFEQRRDDAGDHGGEAGGVDQAEENTRMEGIQGSSSHGTATQMGTTTDPEQRVGSGDAASSNEVDSGSVLGDIEFDWVSGFDITYLCSRALMCFVLA